MSDATLEIVPLDALSIFDNQGAEAYLKQLEEEVLAIVPDLSTVQGRKDIASIAHRISRRKVELDNLGKELVADQRQSIKRVDAERKKWRDGCDALRDKYRDPLTRWEREQERKDLLINAAHRHVIDMIKCDYTRSSSISASLRSIERMELHEFFPNHLLEFREDAISDLKVFLIEALAAEKKAQEAATELARLKEAETKRIEEEADRKAEADRRASELKAAQDAKERAEREAKESKVREERRKADEEKRIEAAKAAAIKAERERAKAEQAAREKKAKLIADEAERKRMAKELADVKRSNQVAHRGAINLDIVTALSEVVRFETEQSSLLINAINDGRIPHIKILY